MMEIETFVVCVQERAADDSKEVEGFQQLLLARTQVDTTEGISPIQRKYLSYDETSETMYPSSFLRPLCAQGYKCDCDRFLK